MTDTPLHSAAYVASCGSPIEVSAAHPAIAEAIDVLRRAGFDAAVVARYVDEPDRWEIETTERTVEGAQQFAEVSAYLLKTHVAEARPK